MFSAKTSQIVNKRTTRSRFLGHSVPTSSGLAALSLLIACSLGTPVQAQDAGATVLETVASGLQHPWAVAFLPGDRFLVTERPGRLRVVGTDGRLGEPLAGLPELAVGGQGGLLDVSIDSDFEQNRTLYFCYSEPGPGTRNSTALARARLAEDERSLQQFQVLFSQQPKVSSRLHFGCRIVEGRDAQGRLDGTLFLTLGERFSQRADAQRLDNHHGKVVRIGKDGSVPSDNPFVNTPGALPEIWSLGHRNPQGAAWGPEGRLWVHEHGPQGGDEINRPQPGANYGWPVVSYGVNYDGSPVGLGESQQAGMEPPLHHWTPSIAPSGMAFLDSDRYGASWRGNLFVGSLKFQYLTRLELDGVQVRAEHRVPVHIDQRVRDVRQGPDGLLYLLTDSPSGRLLRLLPAK